MAADAVHGSAAKGRGRRRAAGLSCPGSLAARGWGPDRLGPRVGCRAAQPRAFLRALPRVRPHKRPPKSLHEDLHKQTQGSDVLSRSTRLFHTSCEYQATQSPQTLFPSHAGCSRLRQRNKTGLLPEDETTQKPGFREPA